MRAKTETQSVHFLMSLKIQNMQNKLTTSSIFQCFCKINSTAMIQGMAGPGAGFIILDGIRMLCEKMYTLILQFNFYTNIILVFKFIKGILFFLDLNGET